MKYLITYDTTNGDILGVDLRGTKETALVEGAGTLNNNVLLGDGFSSAAGCRVVTINLGERKMRAGIESIDSNTQLTLSRSVDTGGAAVAVTYKLCGYEAEVSHSTEEANDAVAAKKIEVGHQNVAALRVTTGLMLAAHTHFVDISDSNKIKDKSEQIVYE